MNRIRMMFLGLFVMTILSIGFGSSPAFGITWFFPQTNFEDDNIEALIETGTPNGIIDVGERLVGVAEFFRSHSGSSSAPIAPEELTAVFDLTVVAKECSLITGRCDFVFTATNSLGGGFLAGRPAGTAVTVYLDNVDNIDPLTQAGCPDLATCIANASAGPVLLDAGFYGDPNEIWVAFGASDNTAVVKGTDRNIELGAYNLALSVFAGTNATGFNFGPISCFPFCPNVSDQAAQLVGGGSIKGGLGLQGEFFGTSDNDVGLRPIPEPSTLLLLGSGLLGLAFISRRRKNK